MARYTFFSFDYDRDVWRASQVRNSWVTKEDRKAAGFWDAPSWEEVKKKGEDAVKRWIDKQLEGTSVTVVLVGAKTNDSKYVDYEIEQSRKRGNGLLAIYIHQQEDRAGNTDFKGQNPFDYWQVPVGGQKKKFSDIYSTYDWIDDNGYENLADWIEQAAKDAGR
ncbi:MAG: TIR domain-containing protein [Limisphaerales bacterium]